MSRSTSRIFQSHEIPVLGFQNLNIGVCPNCPPAHCSSSSKKRKTGGGGGGGGGGEDHRILPKLLPVHSPDVDSYLDRQSSGRLHQTKKGTRCTPSNCDPVREGCKEYCDKFYQKARQHDGNGNNMLHHLIRRGLGLGLGLGVGLDADRKLLRALCRPELINVQNKRGETPVYIAASEGKGECLAQLIAAGADVHTSDIFGQTPVYVAAAKGRAGSLAQLIAAGANVNTANKEGRTPVWIAARYGKDGCLAQLIAAHAKVNIADNYGQSPVFIADRKGYASCVALLIAVGQ